MTVRLLTAVTDRKRSGKQRPKECADHIISSLSVQEKR